MAPIAAVAMGIAPPVEVGLVAAAPPAGRVVEKPEATAEPVLVSAEAVVVGARRLEVNAPRLEAEEAPG
jgi:hypothetical protein